MTLVFCSYRLDKKRTEEEEEDVQIYYSAKMSVLFFKPARTNSSASVFTAVRIRPPTEGRHWYVVASIHHNNFHLSGSKVKYRPKNILYVMALIRKVSI